MLADADTHETLRRMLDRLFARSREVERLDVLISAEVHGVDDPALSVVRLLPPGRYDRARLCAQLNSAITARGLSRIVGTLE